MSKKERRVLNLSGHVQGVGFRNFTERQAEKFGVAGWVRNEPDGTVMVEVEGDPATLDDFQSRIKQGPAFGNVRDMKVTTSSPTGETGFRVIF